MTDQQIPGGCDVCAAYQTMRTPWPGSPVYVLTVHHDPGCRELARIEGRESHQR
jgi:hypothetical protein